MKDWGIWAVVAAGELRRQLALFFAGLPRFIEDFARDLATLEDRRRMAVIVEAMEIRGEVTAHDLFAMVGLGMNIPPVLFRMVLDGNPPPVATVVDLATAYHSDRFTKMVTTKTA